MSNMEEARVAISGWQLGQTSVKHETGGRGASTISTGKDDHGGRSYGAYQLSSKTGTLLQYLESSSYKRQFDGLKPVTPAFDARWRELAATDPGFAEEQHDFIQRTHYDVMMAKLKQSGVDLSSRGRAVQDAVWSTSVQFGPGRISVITRGLEEKFHKGYELSSLSDRDIIGAIQDYKIAHNQELFRSSPKWQSNLLRRAHEEKAELIQLASYEHVLAHEGHSPAWMPLAQQPSHKPEHSVHSSSAEGVLKLGERGTEVSTLQGRLSRLGFRDADGRALKVDGHFGANTEEALRAFRRDSGIREDGIAGPRVKVALERAERLAQAPAAQADGLLGPGEHGPAVNLLQESLGKLGYRDEKGQPLRADGHFSAGTEEALRAFQHDRGLKVDGIAGVQTLMALKQAVRAPLVTEVCHGDHVLYLQALAGVHRLDAQHQRTPDERSERLAAALVVEAKRSGLERIDEVALGRDAERVFAVQKGSHAVFDRNVHVDTMPAMNQTVLLSSEQLSQINQERAQQVLVAEQQQQQIPERSHGFTR